MYHLIIYLFKCLLKVFYAYRGCIYLTKNWIIKELVMQNRILNAQIYLFEAKSNTVKYF